MSSRALVVLGTSAGVPTRTRNHSGFVLLWDRERLLVDPGEGTQRQLQHVGVSAGSLTRIAVTHAHGDHCLGLPGVLQRRVFDGVVTPIDVHAPAEAVPRLRQLVEATHHGGPEVARWRGEPGQGDSLRLVSRPLDHRVPCVGYRWEEPDALRVVPGRLQEVGLAGPDVGRLLRDGTIEVGGRLVHRGEVTELRRGQSAAFILDTRLCDGALELARGVDLLMVEATYLDRDRELAREYGHLTAAQAGELAARAGARRLVLVHRSQRYGSDESAARADFLAEAGRWHDDVWVPTDLDVVPLPARRGVQ